MSLLRAHLVTSLACASALAVTTIAACSSSSDDGVAPAVDSGPTIEAGEDTEPPGEDAAPPACTVAVNKGPWVVATDETSAKVRWEACVPGASGLSLTPEGGGATTHVASKVTTTVIAD
ncbi:MAG: hypothetical protein ABI175_13445, partial [Polyangiales bacterium]